MLIVTPAIGTKANHARLHAPFVGGISLDHVSKEGFSWIRSIAQTEAVDEQKAIALLGELISRAKGALQARIDRLGVALTESVQNHVEAEKLAATPVVGNEAAIVTGYVAMLDTAVFEATRASDNRAVHDANALRTALPEIRAFKTASLATALQDLDKQEKKIAQAEQQLGNMREKLGKLLNQIGDADRRELLDKVRLNIALDRAAPKALEELRILRIGAQALTERCDRTIKMLQEAMGSPNAAR